MRSLGVQVQVLMKDLDKRPGGAVGGGVALALRPPRPHTQAARQCPWMIDPTTTKGKRMMLRKKIIIASTVLTVGLVTGVRVEASGSYDLNSVSEGFTWRSSGYFDEATVKMYTAKSACPSTKAWIKDHPDASPGRSYITGSGLVNGVTRAFRAYPNDSSTVQTVVAWEYPIVDRDNPGIDTGWVVRSTLPDPNPSTANAVKGMDQPSNHLQNPPVTSLPRTLTVVRRGVDLIPGHTYVAKVAGSLVGHQECRNSDGSYTTLSTVDFGAVLQGDYFAITQTDASKAQISVFDARMIDAGNVADGTPLGHLSVNVEGGVAGQSAAARWDPGKRNPGAGGMSGDEYNRLLSPDGHTLTVTLQCPGATWVSPPDGSGKYAVSSSSSLTCDVVKGGTEDVRPGAYTMTIQAAVRTP